MKNLTAIALTLSLTFTNVSSAEDKTDVSRLISRDGRLNGGGGLITLADGTEVVVSPGCVAPYHMKPGRAYFMTIGTKTYIKLNIMGLTGEVEKICLWREPVGSSRWGIFKIIVPLDNKRKSKDETR